jgi:hypothetical protein
MIFDIMRYEFEMSLDGNNKGSRDLPGQSFDRRWHCRSKHYGLPVLVLGLQIFHESLLVFGQFVVGFSVGHGHVVQDLLNVRLETHVNHSIAEINQQFLRDLSIHSDGVKPGMSNWRPYCMFIVAHNDLLMPNMA